MAEEFLDRKGKSSQQELLLDYENYIITRDLAKWPLGDSRLENARRNLKTRMSREYMIKKAKGWSYETFANVAGKFQEYTAYNGENRNKTKIGTELNIPHNEDTFYRRLFQSPRVSRRRTAATRTSSHGRLQPLRIHGHSFRHLYRAQAGNGRRHQISLQTFFPSPRIKGI